MPDNRELEIHIRESAMKLDYAFLTLTFATLALSFQYSPGMGIRWPWLLILSWAFLITSGLVGGWRLVQLDVHHQYTLRRSKLTASVVHRQKSLLDPSLLDRLESGEILDQESYKAFTVAGAREDLEAGKKNLAKLKENMEKVAPRVATLFKWQWVTFVIGIVFNGSFAAVNYLAKAFSW